MSFWIPLNAGILFLTDHTSLLFCSVASSCRSPYLFISFCTLFKNSLSSSLEAPFLQQLLQGLLLWKHLSLFLQDDASRTGDRGAAAVYSTLSRGIGTVPVWPIECIPACGTEETPLSVFNFQLPGSNSSVLVLSFPLHSHRKFKILICFSKWSCAEELHVPLTFAYTKFKTVFMFLLLLEHITNSWMCRGAAEKRAWLVFAEVVMNSVAFCVCSLATTGTFLTAAEGKPLQQTSNWTVLVNIFFHKIW